MLLTLAPPLSTTGNPARTARLDQVRALYKAAGWSARVVTLTPADRAERTRDYALPEG